MTLIGFWNDWQLPDSFHFEKMSVLAARTTIYNIKFTPNGRRIQTWPTVACFFYIFRPNPQKSQFVWDFFGPTAVGTINGSLQDNL